MESESRALSWHNDPVPLADWPALREESFAPLPRRYRRLRMMLLVVLAVAPPVLAFLITGLCAWFTDGFRMPWLAAGGPSVVWWLVMSGVLWAERRAFPLRGYLLREHDLTFRKGWLFRSRVTVPFNRVQHSEVVQGPLQRWKNLSTLKIYTAGSSGANLSIAGLDDEVAQILRQTLNDRIGD
jgi:membrane protein YdbS with pleckstrin-like domain